MRIKDRLRRSFHDFAYRHAYVDEFTDAYVATQIKVLREQRELTQVQLAKLAGMRQSQVSDLENVNHRAWKVSTLKKLARAFDLVLSVRFEPFGKVLPDIGHLERRALERQSFADDPVFSDSAELSASVSRDQKFTHPRKGAVVLNAPARFRSAMNRFGSDVSNVA